MTKDFPDPTKIPVPSLDGDEVVVGVHSSGIMLEEGLNTSLSRNYCSNCKKKIHCYVKVDKKTKEAIVHNTCKSTDCECKCKTHYACKQCGSLHPYGQKCNRIEVKSKSNTKSDTAFEKLLSDWRNKNKSNQQLVQKKKEVQ